MEEEIRILLVEPWERPRLVTIEHTLEKLQEMVDGYIECHYPREDPVAIVCCGDAKLKGYPPNRMLLDDKGEPYDFIAGNFFICGLSYDNLASISNDLAEKYTDLFYWPEMLLRTMDDHVVWIRMKPGEEPKVIV